MSEVMTQELPQPIAVRYNNDVFFKFMLTGEDQESWKLCKFFIEEVSEIKVKRIECLNSEVIPESIIGKKLILDVLLEDEHKFLYNCEMQVFGYNPKMHLRFQAYGYRIALKQLERGDDYTNMKPFYQIIFINALPYGEHRLIDHMTVKGDNNKTECCNTLNRAYVYLPVAMEIFKEKGYAAMTEFELVCYVLAYGPNDDILKLNRRMVNIIVGKFNEMKQNEQLWSWADSAARGEQFVKACIMDAEETGKEIGKKIGKEVGIRSSLLKQIKKKYHFDASEWLDTLNEHQLLNVSDLILDYDTFQELRDAIVSTNN